MIPVDHDAPVVENGQVEVPADLATVWSVLSDIARWPTWNPDIREIRLGGEVTEGTTFTWRSGPGTITSTLLEVEPPRFIAWRGSMFGIKAVHVWRLDRTARGTVVTTEESWKGPIPWLLRAWSRRKLREAIASGLRYLEIQVQSAAPESGAVGPAA